MKVLELYAGIGGVAATGADVVAAIDHDPYAHAVYTRNFSHPALRLNLVSVKPDRLAAFHADVWWLSPPCQPFTIRGARRDVDDRRCESLLHLLTVIPKVRPRRLIVENVPGFEGSVAHARLRSTLSDYRIEEVEWCPSLFGVPVQRRRFFLLASLDPFSLPEPSGERRPLAAYLDPSGAPLPAALDRFRDAMHVVDADDPAAEAVCFTGAYGHSPVYAGSYLRQGGDVRLFTPREIARLHGFPEGFALHEDPRRATKQLGNCVSVDVARALLASFTTPTLREAPGRP